MKETLDEINEVFQSGRHKEAVASIVALIEESSTDSSLHMAYDSLGKYLNFMGQHTEAVQAWEDGLKFLESTVERVHELDDHKLIDWINISLQTARLAYRQGIDGPGVSHKQNQVCYTVLKMTDTEQEEWKTEQFQRAIKHFNGALENIPANNKEIKQNIQLSLARVLFALKRYDEAVKIYEDGFSVIQMTLLPPYSSIGHTKLRRYNDGDPQWLYNAAECLWQQDKKELAYTRLLQLIGTEPTFATAYKMLATYFTEKNDTTSAAESTCKYKFYSWVPSFCHHIEYNPENISTVEQLNSDQALECINARLANDESKRATEFLAAICYHHYHGPVENKAFEELERRGNASEGAERDFIGSKLMHLIRNHQSVCTVKGAADALAGMKHEDLFDILERLLPQDVNTFFPMHIPTALGKLGDLRAIPLLEKIIKNSIGKDSDVYESDSSDGLFSSCGKDRLTVESCLALAPFIDNETAKQILLDGINYPQTREACLAVLCISTEENQFFEKLEEILKQHKTLSYMVQTYVMNNAEKSHYAEKLLALNKEFCNKKTELTNDDDNEIDE
ncbi:unnamed protein product [Rotaria magnacalcarata]|uniref:Tetratricopeptide repeat protein n=1 Tax=Rotaria magnacalcarata TaxID=392030 RepID=A0A820A1P8_9BILA|nr:unnamed protein product [Rotaria magnacalcarata]